MTAIRRPCTSSSGFTLVELSVVLVIIGLIVGGVLVGRDMIRAAELRAAISEYERFQTAMTVFRDKYNCLPGDCANATQFFPIDSNGCPAGGGTTGTCNGDGDYHIVGVNYREIFQFWKQLSLDGLIAGSYTGAQGATNPAGHVDHDPGSNAPLSKLPGAVWAAEWSDSNTWLVFFPGSYNAFYLGFEIDGNRPLGGGLSAHDAWNIDTKIDEGLPGTGSVRTFLPSSGYAGNCASTNVATTAVYNVTQTAKQCTMIFRMVFAN
jgi:prepilin-type N-terminal cleavage/methylation domain-containing protein